MKLSSLIDQANTTYDLGLSQAQRESVFGRLRHAGFSTTLTASKTGDALDAIFVMADDVQGVHQAVASYEGMKQETVVAFTDTGCPRCHDQLQTVLLVSKRQAHYCQACHITLPMKV